MLRSQQLGRVAAKRQTRWFLRVHSLCNTGSTWFIFQHLCWDSARKLAFYVRWSLGVVWKFISSQSIPGIHNTLRLRKMFDDKFKFSSISKAGAACCPCISSMCITQFCNTSMTKAQLYTNYMENIFLCRFDSKIIPLDFIWPHKLFLDWRFHLHYCVLSFENTNSPVYYISQQEVWSTTYIPWYWILILKHNVIPLSTEFLSVRPSLKEHVHQGYSWR